MDHLFELVVLFIFRNISLERNKFYIGETSRTIYMRTNEHKSAMKKRQVNIRKRLHSFYICRLRSLLMVDNWRLNWSHIQESFSWNVGNCFTFKSTSVKVINRRSYTIQLRKSEIFFTFKSQTRSYYIHFLF